MNDPHDDCTPAHCWPYHHLRATDPCPVATEQPLRVQSAQEFASRCPEHGLRCVGPECCCRDKHPVGNAQEYADRIHAEIDRSQTKYLPAEHYAKDRALVAYLVRAVGRAEEGLAWTEGSHIAKPFMLPLFTEARDEAWTALRTIGATYGVTG